MEEAAALSDRIGILVRGELAALDTPSELVRLYAKDPRVEQVVHGDVTLEDVLRLVNGREGRHLLRGTPCEENQVARLPMAEIQGQCRAPAR